ncbi:acyloxyacyl hydrolase [Bacteroides sp. 519]|uniref:acyloxyacyl hydrolase n=1 Tax=Bacteroides sp. 519 TaxID=2302937 RepID=UPI0013D3EFB8|nr:acyloxyacyl hydrolase [Bacteroides sp. 519]NDV56646.1 hypothetical protein [Bacteroides sp. 519]
MKKLLCICLLSGLMGFSLHAKDLTNDSIKPKLPHFLIFNASNGAVIPTNDFVAGEYKIPHYSSFSIKYGLTSTGDDWKDHAYGMPYGGIGFYMANFYRNHDLGTPFSLYFFQGAQLFRLKHNLSLNYEWNLGGSFNWKCYDPFDNPNNIALGSSVNIHVAGNLFLKWRLSKHFDIHLGAGFTHFSNGAYSLPNKGLNMVAGFVELAYYFNRKDDEGFVDRSITPPPFRKKIDHDLMILISSRNARVDTLNTGLSSEFTDRKFKVLGISYARLFQNSYKYKWGPSIEFTYDESAGIKSWRQIHPESGKIYDRVKLGKLGDRFSLGVSLKGEIAMPVYSLFANLGYDIIHANVVGARFYQILGVKVYLKDNLFGTFGIKATNFGKAQFLYWNLGYTFSQERKKK